MNRSELAPRRRRADDPFPGWLPDWRDATSYACAVSRNEQPIPLDQFSLSLFGWQFLRRNPEYVSDWNRFDALPNSELVDSVPCKSPKWSHSYMDSTSMDFFHANQEVIAGETVGQYEHRTGEEAELLRVWLEKKWGVLYVYDPREACPPFLGAGESLTDGLPPFYEEHAVKISESQSTVRLVGIDIRYDIGPQLEAARDYLNERIQTESSMWAFEQERLKPPSIPQPTKLANYLRAYDAAWSGATNKEIAQVLYPRKDPLTNNVPRAIECAVELIAENYRDLLIKSVWPDT